MSTRTLKLHQNNVMLSEQKSAVSQMNYLSIYVQNIALEIIKKYLLNQPISGNIKWIFKANGLSLFIQSTSPSSSLFHYLFPLWAEFVY